MRAALAITSVAFRNAFWGKPWNRTTQTQAIALAKAAEWMVFPLVAFAIGAVTGLLMFHTHVTTKTLRVSVPRRIVSKADLPRALGAPLAALPSQQLNPNLPGGTCQEYKLGKNGLIFACFFGQ